jgi:tyrosyl-tRNA synthetase
VQQFLVRENFAKRLDKGEPIFLHETFYALMQGYDAVAQQTDVQVGGTDQLFNIIVAGRKLQEALGQRPLVGIITGILPGTDGNQRMSKSQGNVIPINTTPDDMYGKVMSLPDFAMLQYMRLVTRWTPAQIDAYARQLESGETNPRDVKMALAREIVAIYYNEDQAASAQESFRAVFQKGALPEEMEEVLVSGAPSIVDFLAEKSLVKSKSEARRLIEQKGVKVSGRTIEDINALLEFDGEVVIQVGKRKYVRARRA